MVKTIIEVSVYNIEVGDKYYYFDYGIVKDGLTVSVGSVDGSHDWPSEEKEDFKNLLETSYAIELALEQYVNKSYYETNR